MTSFSSLLFRYYQYQAVCDPSHLPISLQVTKSDPNKPEAEEEEVVIVYETEKIHNTICRPYLLQIVPPPSDPPLSLLSAQNQVVKSKSSLINGHKLDSKLMINEKKLHSEWREWFR